MKDGVHPLDRRAGHARFSQVSVDEINLSGGAVLPDIVAMPARQIIHNSNLRPAREQMIRERRADEGSSARHQYQFSGPKSFRRRHAFTASSIIFTNFCNSLTL